MACAPCVEGGLAVEVAATATAVAAVKATTVTAIATAEATAAAIAAWAFHHQVNAGAGWVRLSAAASAGGAGGWAIQLGAKVCIRAGLLVVKTVVLLPVVVAWLTGLAWLTTRFALWACFTAEFTWLTRFTRRAWFTGCLVAFAVAVALGVGAARVVTRGALARTVKALAAAALLAVLLHALLALPAFCITKITCFSGWGVVTRGKTLACRAARPTAWTAI